MSVLPRCLLEALHAAARRRMSISTGHRISAKSILRTNSLYARENGPACKDLHNYESVLNGNVDFQLKFSWSEQQNKPRFFVFYFFKSLEKGECEDRTRDSTGKAARRS